MSRLAWFTPLPPDRSGIAAYSAELLPLLASSNDIHVFVEALRPSGPGTTPADRGAFPPVFSAHDFVWHHTLRPYDLVVYQLGNATCHDYMWAYFPRYPGLVVLHDGQLHHARARQLLVSARATDYEAELRYSHPSAPEGLADHIRVAEGGSLFYLWPFLRIAVESSRTVAVHSAWLARELAAEYPGARLETISMGTADPLEGASGRELPLRQSLGIADAALVFAAFGRVTPEKRVGPLLRALREVRAYVPDAHLLLVGEQADYYDVKSEARKLHVRDAVTVTGYVPDADLPRYIAAADVCVSLRWPTGRETSASWLRCLGAGKPTIVTELAHGAAIPALNPHAWTPMFAADSPESGLLRTPPAPVAVAIDILDEEHSLGRAMRRLAADQGLRTTLGAEARKYWERSHTLARMAEDYERVMAAARDAPPARRGQLPAHLLADGTATARSIAASLGQQIDFL
jgi:glycosyltransferase involved in cell wall biosynthesis